MPVKEEIRDMIVKGATSTDIKKEAMRLGMKTLRMSGLTKIKDGVTTLEEILRVTFAD